MVLLQITGYFRSKSKTWSGSPSRGMEWTSFIFIPSEVSQQKSWVGSDWLMPTPCSKSSRDNNDRDTVDFLCAHHHLDGKDIILIFHNQIHWWICRFSFCIWECFRPGQKMECLRSLAFLNVAHNSRLVEDSSSLRKEQLISTTWNILIGILDVNNCLFACEFCLEWQITGAFYRVVLYDMNRYLQNLVHTQLNRIE